MKYILILITTLLSQLSFAQQISYQDWKEQAKTDIRLLPEYGNADKLKEQIEIDKEFINNATAQDGSASKASEHLIKLGFTYLYRGDLKTAMYRFNQAYLLDQKNDNIYWGYGAIYFYFNDIDEALRQYEKGLAMNPNNSNILTDEATIYTSLFQNKRDLNYLNKAIDIFTRSYKIDPTNQNTLFKLSASYYYKQDCTNAWKFYEECKKLGGKPIPEEYTNALKKMCNK